MNQQIENRTLHLWDEESRQRDSPTFDDRPDFSIPRQGMVNLIRSSAKLIHNAGDGQGPVPSKPSITCINRSKGTWGQWDGRPPSRFEWRSLLVVDLERSIASRSRCAEVKLAPRSTERLRILNQHST
jgi:hypothetical protein